MPAASWRTRLADYDRVAAERDALVAERNELLGDRTGLLKQCLSLQGQHDELSRENARLQQDLERRRAEHDRVARALGGHIDFSDGPPRDNASPWSQLQEDDYSANREHLKLFGSDSREVINSFAELKEGMKVVVLGSGQGREAVEIGPSVGHVYGIDVNEKILEKAKAFAREHGAPNFTGVLASEYKTALPDQIDLVYSIGITKYLSTDLVKDYISNLGPKLSLSGSMLIQFLEELAPQAASGDTEPSRHEPSVSWNVPQLVRLAATCGVVLREVRTRCVAPDVLWHWAHFAKA